jgi:hypothetical protein
MLKHVCSFTLDGWQTRMVEPCSSSSAFVDCPDHLRVGRIQYRLSFGLLVFRRYEPADVLRLRQSQSPRPPFEDLAFFFVTAELDADPAGGDLRPL